MAATLTLLHFVMYLPFTACLVQRTVSLERRLLSAGENEYSTGYILCQQKIYFFSKIFHFFPFFPGKENGESGPEFCWMTGGKRLGGNAPGWTGPPAWALAPRRSAVEWGRLCRQPGAERTAEGYRATEGRQPEKAAHGKFIKRRFYGQGRA